MKKLGPDRVTILAAKMASPEVIPEIDRALSEMREEWLEILDLRKMAVRRHGEIGAAPMMPATQMQPEAPPEQQTHRPEKRGDFELTVARLIARYKADENSGYSKLRFRTRQHYESLLRRIERDIGPELIGDIDDEHLKRVHEQWTSSGIAMAHGLVVMLRGLAGFGASVLKSKECRDLKYTISEAGFKPAKPRIERLTAEHAKAIISRAHEIKLHSIALAQALQFECGLHQRDVIGEWVPETEPGESDVHHEGQMWLRGIRWSEISKDFVLHHPTSKDGKLIELRLTEFPLVKKELARHADKQGTTGPMIVSELTDRPFVAWQFREIWRDIATAAGVPENVRNMDSRASR
jgi:hypothetical protein